MRLAHRLLHSVTLATLILASVHLAEAQQPKKVPRIGVLRVGSPPDPYVEAFRRALQDLGYVEGKNIAIEYRWADFKYDRLPDLAADLVRLKVDVIVTTTEPGVRAAKNATTMIPIVMAGISDPLGSGLIASLARPGGNITGISNLSLDLGGKRLELLTEAVPGISRVAVLFHPNENGFRQVKALEDAARTLRVQLQPLEVHPPNPDFAGLFRTATTAHADALLTTASPPIFNNLTRIVELAAKSRLAALYEDRQFVEAGGLMSYGPDRLWGYRRAAYYVDRILKGARPADLPVEQPTKFEFVINLKTAKQIGLTIPPNVLARADKVIK